MSRDIDLLHPEMRERCLEFIEACRKSGLIVGISQTWRTKAEQDELYAQGRTKPGSIVTNCRYPYSPHNWGVAFDIYRNDGQGAYNDGDGWFKCCGQVGKRLGLFWGGDFKSFVDKPHFELPDYLPSNSCRTLISKYGTPERFKSTWKEEDTVTQEQFDKMIETYLANRAKQPASTWARDALASAKAAGITDGTSPKGFATREEVVTMIERSIK